MNYHSRIWNVLLQITFIEIQQGNKYNLYRKIDRFFTTKFSSSFIIFKPEIIMRTKYDKQLISKSPHGKNLYVYTHCHVTNLIQNRKPKSKSAIILNKARECWNRMIYVSVQSWDWDELLPVLCSGIIFFISCRNVK
jgi:hypothetical protein